MRTLILAAGLLPATPGWRPRPLCSLSTPTTASSPNGAPAPRSRPRSRPTCACDLQFVPAGDGAALLARLRLEGARHRGRRGPRPRHQPDRGGHRHRPFRAAWASQRRRSTCPSPGTTRCSCPSTGAGSPLSTTRRSSRRRPTVLRGTGRQRRLQILIQDPRSSTPGLGLLLWVKAAYGDEAPAIWAALADNIVTVTPGWSEAYGLFLEGEADMVLSYTTSPAYHLIAEDDATKAAAPFTEGHYLQVEVAGKLAATDQPDLARRLPGLHADGCLPVGDPHDQLDVSGRDARGGPARRLRHPPMPANSLLYPGR